MWILRSDQRLAEWKKFRKKISELDSQQAIQSTTQLWSFAPFVNHYLDPATPKEWPNPWQLLDENYYCDLAKALGMLYTLALSKPDLELELRVYEDSNKNIYNVVWIDQGEYVINYWHNETVNKAQLEEDLKLKFCYTAEHLNLNQY